DYPENFDIILVKARIVASVRDGVLDKLSKLADYKFSGLPLVNGKGFSISVNSSREFAEFLADIDALERQALYQKWMRFETYRKVIFTNNYWEV
ncbi:MAG: sulfate adenylyltransferase, partial [Clostridia bacterium]|nr:sulfate adenylyltransferase [Clostridia bacterium]